MREGEGGILEASAVEPLAAPPGEVRATDPAFPIPPGPGASLPGPAMCSATTRTMTIVHAITPLRTPVKFQFGLSLD